MSMFDLKILEKETLSNIEDILDSDEPVEQKQEVIQMIIDSFKMEIEYSKSNYKQNALDDFRIEVKRMLVFEAVNVVV